VNELRATRSALLIPSVIYALLFVGAANAALRPSADTPITPWYVIFPFVTVTLGLVSREFRRWTMWFGVLCIYGFFTGLSYGVPGEMIALQLLKYVELLAYMGLLSWLLKNNEHARADLMRLVVVLVMLVGLLAAVESATGFELPTVHSEESRDYLEAFFFTANDVGLFLGAVVVLVLASRARLFTKLLLVAAITMLNWRNDAKAVVLSTVLVVLMWMLLAVCQRLRVRPLTAILLFVVAVPLGIYVLVTQVAPEAEGDYSVMQLLLDPLNHVMQLEPYELGGSVFDRTDSLIYNLRAFFSTYGLGLGPAGSVYTLSLAPNSTMTAASLHNAIAELFVELGPVALLLAVWFIAPVIRAAATSAPTQRTRARLLLLAAAPLLSVSQSSGYISNYGFWLVAFVIWNLPDTPWQRRRRVVQPLQNDHGLVATR
jgi:hypothetical protein